MGPGTFWEMLLLLLRHAVPHDALLEFEQLH